MEPKSPNDGPPLQPKQAFAVEQDSANTAGVKKSGVAVGRRESSGGCFDRYIDVLIDWPRSGFCGCCLFVLVLVIISMMAGFMTPMTENDHYQWQVASADQTKMIVAWDEAKKMLDGGGRLLKQAVDSTWAHQALQWMPGATGRRLADDFYDVVFYYNAPPTVFSPQTLQDICQLEKILAQTPGASGYSVLSYFYGSCPGGAASCDILDLSLDDYDWGCQVLASGDVDAVVAHILSDVQLLQTSSSYSYIVDRQFVNTGETEYSQSSWTLTAAEAEAAVKAVVEDELGLSGGYARSALVVDDDRFTAYKSLRVRMYSGFDIEPDLVMQDFGLAGFAMFFVLFVMCVHTNSCWIGCCGMGAIMAACPIASLIYQGVFQIKIFSYVHMLIIFVILGVGADDVFVFVDAFKNAKEAMVTDPSQRLNRADMHRVLKHSLKSSAASMLNTSLTTAVAFLTNSVSPIVGIRTMGWFAGLSVFACYFLTISLTAVVLVIHHYHFEKKRCCCPHPGEREVQSEDPEDDAELDMGRSRSDVIAKIFRACDHDSDGRLSEAELQHFAVKVGFHGTPTEWSKEFKKCCVQAQKDPNEGLDLGAFTCIANDKSFETVFRSTKQLRRFLKTVPHADGEVLSQASSEEHGGWVQKYLLERGYIRAMSFKIGRIAIGPLIVAVALGATAIQGIAFASQLGPESKPTQWIPDNHMYTFLGDFISATFYSPQYDFFGNVYYVWGIDDLDLSVRNTYAPQNNPGEVVFDSKFDLSTPETQNAILQFCEDMQTMLCTEDACENTAQPTRTLMMQSDIVTHSCFLAHFKNYTGGTLPTGSDFYSQLKDFRDQYPDWAPEPWASEASAHNYREEIGFINGELKYVAVKIRSTFRTRQPYTSGKPVQDRVEEWTEQQRASMPSQLKSLKMFGGDGFFASYDLGSALIDGFFAGIGLASPFVFFVLVASTRNVLVALYAVFSVGSIVLCVLGFCKSAMDWDLGIAESIAGVIVIGYSVDYVLHLAHMYGEAREFGCHTRTDRANYTIRNLGTTVFAGAITTGGAGSVLFGCYLVFFYKMAVLIVATIVFSLLYSLGFFMSLLYLIGPEGHVAELPEWLSFTHLVKRCSGKGDVTVSPVETAMAD